MIESGDNPSGDKPRKRSVFLSDNAANRLTALRARTERTTASVLDRALRVYEHSLGEVPTRTPTGKRLIESPDVKFFEDHRRR